MHLLSDKYFSEYQTLLNRDLSDALPIGEKPVFAPDSFSFYTSIASVYSSKIEGEDIDLNSYSKHRFHKSPYKPIYTKKIDDLFDAYTFAEKSELNLKNVLKAHALLSKNLVKTAERGKIRHGIEQIIDNQTGNIVYVATDPKNVKSEMNKFFADIDFLLSKSLTTNESFYYASLIHLFLLKIHPFSDGNGRSSRLLEKWFLARKLGEKAWFLKSEQHYYNNLPDYYRNLQRLGWEYETLNYDRCLPFLLMLPQSLYHGLQSVNV
jgi:Fic family protein